MNNTEFDEYILSIVHDLLFGDFERTNDGRSRLLEKWYEEYKGRLHELASEVTKEDEK